MISSFSLSRVAPRAICRDERTLRRWAAAAPHGDGLRPALGRELPHAREGKGGAERPDVLDFLSPENERSLVATIPIALTAAAKLDLQDGGQKADDARSLLRNLGTASRASQTTSS